MQAVQYLKRESVKFRIRELPIPGTKPNEVLIRVAATSLNAADYRSLGFGAIPKSKIFGSAVSGVIEAIGSDVSDFKVSDKVIADLSDAGFGGLSEYVAAPRHAICIKPCNLDHNECATLPLAATTAYHAIAKKAEIQPGQKVMILGSGGGVGSFLVQLAHHFEADIVAVCSPKNIDYSKEMGAKRVIDYTKENPLATDERFDYIYAVNGNYSLSGCMKLLKPNGTYLAVGGSLSQIFKALLLGWLYSLGKKKVVSISAKANVDDLKAITRLSESGAVRPVQFQEFNLSQVNEAMQLLKTGQVKGKVIVSVEC